MVTSLVSKSIIGTAVLSSWQSPHTGSLTYEVTVIMLIMAKWKPLKLTNSPPSALTERVITTKVQEKLQRLVPPSKVQKV